jgi:hypothetical protein
MKRYSYIVLFYIFFYSFHLNSQTSIENELFGSAGSNLSNASCQLSFSIGETVTSSFQFTNLLVTQGFQQPLEWNSITNLTQTDLSNSGLAIYPNPFLTDITIINKKNMYLDCKLYDLASRLINVFEIREHINLIDLSYLPSGTYQLVFTNNDFIQFTFPLIKIN